MSDLDDLSFACKKVISVKEEVEICETQLLEQIFDGFEVTHVDPCVKIEKEIGVVNEIFHVTEDNQTELNDCEGIREQPYECYLRPDNSTSSARKHEDIRPSLKNNHICSICAKSFRSSSRLKVHMNVHTGSQPYACTICPRKYASHDGLRAHILTHGSGFKCTFCEKSYKSRSGMNKHIKIHHGERNFQCEICSKSFTSKYLLSSHHKTHSDKKKYECTLCSEKFAENSKRLRHEKTHTNNHSNYHECENCKKCFRSEDQYRSHMKGKRCIGYVSEKLFKCSKCENESFVSIELLNQHKVEVHPPPKKNHACSVCAKAYRYDAELRVHMNIHTGKRPYACTICSKAFTWPSNLRKHMLTHSAEAKNRSTFKCTLCEKLCSSRGRLNSHMNMHRGERPFKCDTCPKTFMSPDTLSSHKKLHADDRENELCNQKFTGNNKRRKLEKLHKNSSMKYCCAKCKKYFRFEHQHRTHLEDNKCKGYASEKPFQCSKCENESFVSIELLNQHKVEVHPPPKKNHACSICEKSFRSSSRLKVHMNVHTGNRPYKCTVCPKKYGCPQSLRYHKLTHSLLSADRKIRGRFKCTLCEKSYLSKIGLNSHKYFHRGERPFKCELCPKSYTSATSLGSHIITHSGEKKFECTLCNLKCRGNSKRRVHEKTHTNRRMNYQCENCKLYFRLEDQHRSHLEDNKCKGYASEKPFQCSKCENESFVSIELLNQHKVEIHPPPKKNHICLICTKTYKHKCLLDIHMNSHTGSRPYTCPICPKRFTRPGSLRRHKLDHNFLSADGKIRGRFKCTLCEKSYYSKTNLNSHMHFHRGERPFKCEICPKSYTSAKSLGSHIITHSDEKKFECTLCHLKCRGNSERRIHEKTHTNRRMNYQCEKCKLYFRLEDQHRSHLEDNKCKGYASEKPFQCSKCENESFVSIELLNQHKVEIHPPPKKNHICLICSKAFKCKALLNSHVNSHTCWPYTCPMCSKRFASPECLSRHKLTHNFLSADTNKTHSDEGKYECMLCNKKCRGNSERRIHEKTHTNRRMNYQCEKCKLYFRLEDQRRSHLEDNKCKGYASEKPFECSKCENESFVSIELLNQHKVEVHPPPRKNHACSVCAKAFRCKYELRVHMNIHTGSRPYACTVCPKKYSSPFTLRSHKLSHSLFKCTLCERSYFSKIGLNSHKYFHRGERPFKCEICPKSYRNPHTLKAHIKMHFDERKYECTLCSKKFAKDSERLRHEKTHTYDHKNYHECENCKKCFRSEDQYRSHMKGKTCIRYVSEKLFKCSKCKNESFVSIELLNQHKIEVHPPPKKNHACSVCAKAFRCKYELRVHMNIHTGSRPYACTVCPKKYSSPFTLRSHKLSHVGAKNRPKYKCTLCEKLCRSRGRLSSHMNKHRGERPFKCETCLKTFISSESLYTHKKFHSSDKKYECTLCNKRFIYNSYRREHEMSHSNHRLPYQCDVCKKYFQLEDQYRSHLADNKCNGNSQESHDRENEKSEKQIQAEN